MSDLPTITNPLPITNLHAMHNPPSEIKSDSLDSEPIAELQTVLSALNFQRNAKPHSPNPAKALSALKDRFEVLTLSLALLRSAFDSSIDGILAMQQSGAVVCVNSRMASLWGWAHDSLEGLSAEQLLTLIADCLLEPAQFMQSAQAFLAEPEVDTSTLLELKDGRVFEYQVKSYRLDNLSVGLVFKFRDITATGLDPELDGQPPFATLENYFRLQAQCRAMGEAALISESDLAGTIITVNANFCALSGYTQEELLGANHRLLNSRSQSTRIYGKPLSVVLFGRGRSVIARKMGIYTGLARRSYPFLSQTASLKNL